MISFEKGHSQLLILQKRTLPLFLVSVKTHTRGREVKRKKKQFDHQMPQKQNIKIT